MHVGQFHAQTPPTSRAYPRPLCVCVVANSAAAFAKGGAERDVAGLRALGHVVVPVLVEPELAHCEPAAIRLDEVETVSALTAAAANPAGLAAAVGFAQRQLPLRRRELLRAAARLAYVARARDCSHIHAHFTGAAASIAICAARIAGIPVTLAGHPSDLRRPEADLRLKLAAADMTVAGGKALAAALRRLVPHARVLALPDDAGAAARLVAAFSSLRA